MFDGVQAPTITVEVAFGSTSTEDLRAAGVFILGESILGGPDVLGSVSWVDVTEDAKSITYGAGFVDDASDASPQTSTIVLDGSTGSYDPTVAESPVSLAGAYPATDRYPSTSDYPMTAPVAGPADAGQVDVGKPVRVRFTWAGVSYTAFTHYVDKITLDAGWEPTVTLECVDGLEALGRASLAELSAPSFAGDRSDVRLTRILDLAGWPTSHRTLEAGLMTLSATTFGNQALPLAQEVADSESGRIFIDPDGRLVFYNRMHIYTATRSKTVQATISDTGGSDVETVELVVTKDRARVYNEARVLRSAEGAVEQVAADPVSAEAYGLRAYPGQVGTLVPSDADAYALASWLVSQYSRPRTEVRRVIVDAIGQGTWAALLPLRLFDRIRAVRDYGPVTVDRQLLIFGYQVTITDEPVEWSYEFSTVDPGTFSPFILGTSVLGGTDRLA